MHDRKKVWQQIVSFAEIPPPQETIFALELPIRSARKFPAAAQRCAALCFFHGAFRGTDYSLGRAAFVTLQRNGNPAPMNELDSLRAYRTAHLHGYFESHRANSAHASAGGRTRSKAQPGTATPVAGTDWHLWSDYIIHNIHLRVLGHIKQVYRSELILVSDCQLLIRASTIGEGGAIAYSGLVLYCRQEQMATNKTWLGRSGRFGQLSQRL